MARTLNRWLPRFVLFACVVLGWFFWRWVGVGVGVCVGLPVAFFVRLAIHSFSYSSYLKRETFAVSVLSNDELKAIVSDPSSLRLGFAMDELEKRGVKAVPSLSSICELLVSDSANNRGTAMTLLGTLYPNVWSRASKEGWSNTDAQDVWRSRLSELLREP